MARWELEIPCHSSPAQTVSGVATQLPSGVRHPESKEQRVSQSSKRSQSSSFSRKRKSQSSPVPSSPWGPKLHLVFLLQMQGAHLHPSDVNSSRPELMNLLRSVEKVLQNQRSLMYDYVNIVLEVDATFHYFSVYAEQNTLFCIEVVGPPPPPPQLEYGEVNYYLCTRIYWCNKFLFCVHP